MGNCWEMLSHLKKVSAQEKKLMRNAPLPNPDYGKHVDDQVPVIDPYPPFLGSSSSQPPDLFFQIWASLDEALTIPGGGLDQRKDCTAL